MSTIFASSARANERVQLHNERNFPFKLNSINARFLLNEHGNLFLLLNNSVPVILFNLTEDKKKSYRKEKDISESVHKTVKFWDANYDLNYTNALRPRRFKLCVFLCDIVYAWHFQPVNFLSSFSLLNYASSYRKM